MGRNLREKIRIKEDSNPFRSQEGLAMSANEVQPARLCKSIDFGVLSSQELIGFLRGSLPEAKAFLKIFNSNIHVPLMDVLKKSGADDTLLAHGIDVNAIIK
ncbi:hypothetical protein HG530_000171 [Fusarium avenaceum]|nr:hypothetical protein HG530_000171 [Fusarium avenaceum]